MFLINILKAYITIVTGKAPSIDLDYQPQDISYNTDLVFTPIIDTSTLLTSISSNSLIYSYRMLSVCNGVKLGTIDLSDTKYVMTSPNVSSTLKIRQGSLSPGSLFCIELEVIDPLQANSGKVSALFTTSRGISMGYCKSLSREKIIGTSFETLFEFQCYDYVSPIPETHVTNTWEISTTNLTDDDTWSIASPPSKSGYFSSVFPPGSFYVRTTVTDVSGNLLLSNVMQIISEEATLSKRDSISDAINLLEKKIIPDFYGREDSFYTISQLAIISNSFESTSTVKQALRTKLVYFLSAILPQLYMDVDMSISLADIITKIAASGVLSQDEYTSIYQLYSNILTSLTSVLKAQDVMPDRRSLTKYFNKV